MLVPYSHHWVVTPNGLITSSLKIRRKKDQRLLSLGFNHEEDTGNPH